MMHPREWTLFLISQTTGREMPHWTAYTRERCRQELRSLKAQCGGKLPRDIRAKICKTFDINKRQVERAIALLGITPPIIEEVEELTN